ncbi:MAG: YecA family protein [Roseovarius sp.]
MATAVRNERNIEALDAYLLSGASPNDCMTLSTLDGFLYGIVCSPMYIAPREWAAIAMGESIGPVPCWVFEAVSSLHDEASLGLANDPHAVEPIFWQSKEGYGKAEDWCKGFMKAVSLRPKAWLRLKESGSHGQLLAPIIVNLLDEQGNSVLGIPEEELAQTLAASAEQIPDAVVGIYRFWRDVA